jgi:hypothetical protein
MEHYVTIFDSLFLPQGLALHMSMERHAGNYVLWILCVDDEAHEVLSRLGLPNVRLLQLSRLGTPELLAVKPGRSKGEYCWTLTPFAPRFVFEADAGVPRVTYLDADMWFRKNPGPILCEFDASGKDVLITDHAYAPENDQSATSGQYCVQFMTFARDGGEPVRKWWEQRCIEWCFARFEDGKFGDQKYLDDWPLRFEESVHVLTNKELMLAPWNATRFPYGNAVTWHFHDLRIVVNSGRWFSLAINSGHLFSVVIDPEQSIGAEFGMYPLPKCTRDNVYLPYLDDLRAVTGKLKSIGVIPKPQKSQQTSTIWGYLKMRLRMRAQGFLGISR